MTLPQPAGQMHSRVSPPISKHHAPGPEPCLKAKANKSNEKSKVVYYSGQDGTRAITGIVRQSAEFQEFIDVQRRGGVVLIAKRYFFHITPV